MRRWTAEVIFNLSHDLSNCTLRVSQASTRLAMGMVIDKVNLLNDLNNLTIFAKELEREIKNETRSISLPNQPPQR